MKDDKIIVSVVIFAVLVGFIYLAYRSGRSAFNSATVVFSNIRVARDRQRSGEIIITLFLFFLVFVISLYLPLLASLVSWKEGSLVAVILLIISLGILYRLTDIIDSGASYKEVIVSFKK